MPATGNYTEEIPPPTAKPPRLPDNKQKIDRNYFVHEVDAKKGKMPKVQLGMSHTFPLFCIELKYNVQNMLHDSNLYVTWF